MVEYSLVGVDGNAFSIIVYVRSAMKKEGFSQKSIDEYVQDAQSKDYNHLLSVSIDQIHKVNAKKRKGIYNS